MDDELPTSTMQWYINNNNTVEEVSDVALQVIDNIPTNTQTTIPACVSTNNWWYIAHHHQY